LLGSDRAVRIWIIRLWPSLIDLAQLVKPETIAISVATLLPSRRPADKISAGERPFAFQW
jgi:hypothetical protein